MSDSKILVEMVRGQRDADELLPMTSYVVQPIYEPTLAVPVTTDLRTQNNDVTAQPMFPFNLSNNINTKYRLPTRLSTVYPGNSNPYCTMPRCYSDSYTPFAMTRYAGQGYNTYNDNYYSRFAPNRTSSKKKKLIIIISSTIITLLVIAIIGWVIYHFTKKTDKEVTLYGTLRLNALEYDDSYDDNTSPAAVKLSTRLCDWMMNDVTTKIETSASFKTCRITDYRRGSVLAYFEITASVSIRTGYKIDVLLEDIIKDLLYASLMAKVNNEVASLDVIITYLNVNKMSPTTKTPTTKTIGSATSSPSAMSPVTDMSPARTVTLASTKSMSSTETSLSVTQMSTSTPNSESTQPVTQMSTSTPNDPCDPDPCVSGTCIQQNDDFFCKCYICGCGAKFVSKTCDYDLPDTCSDNIPDPFDCSKYYMCNMNQMDTHQTSCSIDGTYYDPTKRYCDFPSNLDLSTCAINITREPPGDTETTIVGTTITTTTEAVTTEPPGPCNPSPCPESINCVATDNDYFCECQVCNCTANLVDKNCSTIPNKITGNCAELGNGYYPVVTDCMKYLWCYTGGQVVQPCAAGTIFIAETGKCEAKDICVNIQLEAPNSG